MAQPKYLAFDPGSTTGFAFFDATGVVTSTGQMKFPDLIEKLYLLNGAPEGTFNDVTFIVEDFNLLPHMALKVAGNTISRKMEASKAIGAIELFAKFHGAKLIMQRPDNGAVAKVWTGLDPDKNHAKDNWKSAYNHGVYYMVMNKILKVKDAKVL